MKNECGRVKSGWIALAILPLLLGAGWFSSYTYYPGDNVVMTTNGSKITISATLGAGAGTGDFLASGLVPMTGNLNFAGFGITNLGYIVLPSSDAEPATSAGQIRHDSAISTLTRGAIKWFDGTGVRILVDLDTAPADDDYVVAYDADADKFYMKLDSTSAGGGDGDAIHDNVSGEIAAITAKATPTTSDIMLLEDAAASNAKKSLTIGSLETVLEGIMDLQDMQGAITDAQVPDNITIATAGTANAGDSATAFFSSGQIERSRGGTGVDTSAYGIGLLGSDGSNNTIDVDTLTELEAAVGSVNIIQSTEIDSSSELRGILSDESGTGSLVFAGGDIGAATASTPSADDNDTSVATTAYVQSELSGYVASANPTFTGSLNISGLTGVGTNLYNLMQSVRVDGSGSITAAGLTITGSGATTNDTQHITNALYLDYTTPGRSTVIGSDGVVTNDVAATGTGAPVRAESPTLITPNIGVATAASVTVNPVAYDASTWNGNTNVPSMDAIRDKLETMGGSASPTTTRGDMIRRGASADERMALGAAGARVVSDGTDALSAMPWEVYTMYDDFLMGVGAASDFNWNMTTGSGGNTIDNPTQDTPGIVSLSTTGANQYPSLATRANTIVLGGGRWLFRTRVKVPNLSDATDNYSVEIGFFDNLSSTNAPTDGLVFYYNHDNNSGNWTIRAYDNTSLTSTNTSVAVAADTWATLILDVNADGSSATGYVNGTSVGTLTALPTGSTEYTGFGWKLNRHAGTTSRKLSIDYGYVYWKPTTPR